MTIDELLALAAAAKTWNPRHLCAMYDAESNCGISSDPVDPCTHDCSYCVGARNAVDDVCGDPGEIERCMFWCGRLDHMRGGAHNISDKIMSFASSAERIASYFGGSSEISAFASAVREFCGASRA